MPCVASPYHLTIRDELPLREGAVHWGGWTWAIYWVPRPLNSGAAQRALLLRGHTHDIVSDTA